jgi:hypothetical protein
MQMGVPDVLILACSEEPAPERELQLSDDFAGRADGDAMFGEMQFALGPFIQGTLKACVPWPIGAVLEFKCMGYCIANYNFTNMRCREEGARHQCVPDIDVQRRGARSSRSR